MDTFVNAIVPVFGVILIGSLFKLYTFPGDTFWPMAARITYFALFPALLVNRLARSHLAGLEIGPLMLGIAIPILIITLILLVIRPQLRMTNAAFTSVFQGSIRFNTYVGLAVVAVLYGNAGLTLAAVAMAILIPLVNILSVIILTHYGGASSTSWRDMLTSLARNPLIIACVVGIVLSASGIGMPFIASEILDIFSRAALPMGLLTVGADLDLRSVRSATYPVLLTSGVKLLALPFLTALVCHGLRIDEFTASILVLFAALPTAPSAYILAQQLGGDVKLMAGLLTVQTALAMVTMPLVVILW